MSGREPVAASSQALLRRRALAWLAQRDHSRAELRRKLMRVAAEVGHEDEVDPLLDWLQANRYLSDARFAEGRVHARAPRLGWRRIEAELREHGVALPASARQSLAATELQRARGVWARRFDGPADDPKERARQARFLLSRGFGADVVRSIVQGATADDPLDDAA